jgi:pilus assembly protein CpaB
MNKAQLIVSGVAILAGGGAFMFSNDGGTPPVAPPPQMLPVDNVLVATHDLSYGASLVDGDLKWLTWPLDAIPAGVVVKSAEPNALETYQGSYVRIPISNGEPLRTERLVKGVTAGLMATILPSGARAVAIDVSANTTAGGFILPNDRVDVIRVYRDAIATKEIGSEVMSSEVVVTNVRVLAMGQTVEKKGTDPVVVGSTATLELTPRQAERIVLAQKTGTLALALRPITDALAKGEAEEASEDEDSIVVMKHGQTLNYRAK